MLEPIRILHVFAHMNRGGAETMIMNLYHSIDRAEIQFDFIVHTEEKGDFDEEIEKLGGRIYRIPRYTGKNHFTYKIAWKNFFEEHPEYKLIHGHVRSTASIYLNIAKKRNVITIAHSHSTSSRGDIFNRLVKKIMQFPIRYKADYLFACSYEAGLWLYGRQATKKNNFKILRNAVDIQKYSFDMERRDIIRDSLNIGERVVVGHVGSFTTPKNHKFLIKIFNDLYQKNENCVLLLVGDGPLRESIITEVKKFGLSESVIFTGLRSDINDLLNAMDIFVFPSIFEGVPVTLIEAQAAGLPCLISDRITEEVKLTNNITTLSIMDSSLSWANKIIEIISLKINRSVIDKISSSDYNINKSSKIYRDMIFEIIGVS